MSARDTDGPRDCHTIVSETEKNKYRDIKDRWTSRKWHRWTYSQRRNEDTEAEQTDGYQVGKEGVVGWTETGIDMYALLILCTKQTPAEGMQRTGELTQCLVRT